MTGEQSFYPYIEPFWMFGLAGRGPVLWAMLAVLLVATVFVRNLYCRFLCPVGAALGALSSLTVSAVQGANPLWPTVDNLTLATAVPEPGTYAMLLAGLGVVGFIARRRRA